MHFASTGALTDIHTVQQNPLGFEKYRNGNVYKYLQGVASTAQYDWVVYDEAGLTVRMVTTSTGPVAIAQAAILASQFGWYLVKGSGQGTAGAIADNGTVNGTSTDGSVDDDLVASAAESQVFNAIARSAPSGGTALFQVNYPYKSLATLD